jgi:type IX secretion system PorP/SprF family membrane protein
MRRIVTYAIKFFLIVLFLYSANDVTGQQRFQFTQYLFNQLLINPACAGMDEALSVTFSNRHQWINLDGAPVTQAFTAHSLFRNVGAGLSIVNDKIGIHKNFGMAGSYAYHFQTGKSSFLSMGLQAEMKQLTSDYSQLAGAAQDPRWGNHHFSRTVFDMGAGLYFKSTGWQSGISAQNMIPGKLTVDDTLSVKLNRSNWFFFLKYKHRLSNNIDVVPSVLFKYLTRSSLSMELTACFVIYKVFTTGVSYRTNESVDFLWRAQLTQQLQVGYSYDHAIGKITTLSSGSHELMVNYIFKFKTNKLVSPR